MAAATTRARLRKYVRVVSAFVHPISQPADRYAVTPDKVAATTIVWILQLVRITAVVVIDPALMEKFVI